MLWRQRCLNHMRLMLWRRRCLNQLRLMLWRMRWWIGNATATPANGTANSAPTAITTTILGSVALEANHSVCHNREHHFAIPCCTQLGRTLCTYSLPSSNTWCMKSLHVALELEPKWLRVLNYIHTLHLRFNKIRSNSSPLLAGGWWLVAASRGTARGGA